jgi:hypothetical protein
MLLCKAMIPLDDNIMHEGLFNGDDDVQWIDLDIIERPSANTRHLEIQKQHISRPREIGQ